MTKKLTWILAAGAIALLASCSDDTKGTTKDKGTPTPEQTITLPEGGADKKITTGDKAVTTTDSSTTNAAWGDKCDKTCPGGVYTCVPVMSGTTAGFCTKECPLADEGKQCAGAPANQYAGCIIPGDAAKTKLYCGFICQGKDSKGTIITFPCPGPLKCGDENPPGSGQKVCIP